MIRKWILNEWGKVKWIILAQGGAKEDILA